MLVSGHEEVDKEHQEIIEEAKDIFKAIKNKDPEETIDRFKQFVYSIREHFDSEEEIMRKYEMDELDAHKELHQNYLELLDKITSHYKEKLDLKDFKKDFQIACNAMTKHIINYDIPVFEKLQKMSKTVDNQ